ncbi:putative carboxylesterase [Helianthus annuus]|nr:putative carboxylesterase [Helianthus annuus]
MESAAKTPKSLTLPWTTRITLWLLDIGLNLIMRKDGTVNRGLLKLVPLTPPSSEPINGVKTYDVVVDPTRKLWFRVFVPTQYTVEDLPVMVFCHGSGYIVASADTVHRHPAQHEDGLDVLKFLDVQENRSKWLPGNANISKCFIAGDSAGGNMAHHVAVRASQFNFEQLQVQYILTLFETSPRSSVAEERMVVGLVSIQPFFGGEERIGSEIRLNGTAPVLTLKQTDWFWNAFLPLGEPYNRDHPVVNVSGRYAVDISKMDLPPTIVVVAGFDILRDWQIRYYEWLKKSGKEVYLVDYPNMFHGFNLLPELPESNQLILEVKDFIHNVLNKVFTALI